MMSAMQTSSLRLVCAALAALAIWLLPNHGALADKPGVDTAGNNLSYPVIWSDGVPKTLPGSAGMIPETDGEWWYWWGTDEDGTPLSWAPDPDNLNYLDDGIDGEYDEGLVPGEGAIRAYLQKDPDNLWQAGAADWYNDLQQRVDVDWIDWGDNLESVDWYVTSKVRTEVVLYKEITEPMLEYGMRHVSGWGADEVHGLAVEVVEVEGEQVEIPEVIEAFQPTVYSPWARMTIQKLHVDDLSEIGEDSLDWEPQLGWFDVTDEDLVNDEPIYNMAVYEGGDGPGYYSAEINVKGKVIYGYTWNVKKLNEKTEHGGEAAGYYRITFSLDDLSDPGEPALLNTFLDMADIIVPVEEELLLEDDDGGSTGGAEPMIDREHNLTYIDVLILDRIHGGGRSNGGGNGNPGGGHGRPIP